MLCNQPDHTPGNQPRVAHTDLESASPVPSMYLVVSDAPERISSSVWAGYPYPVGQLYRCSIPIPAGGELALRVFLWHVNEMGAARNLWIVLRTGQARLRSVTIALLRPLHPHTRNCTTGGGV